MHTLHITLGFIEHGTPKEWQAPVMPLDADTHLSLALVLAHYTDALPPGPKIFEVRVRREDVETGMFRITHVPPDPPSLALYTSTDDVRTVDFLAVFNAGFVNGLGSVLSSGTAPRTRDTP